MNVPFMLIIITHCLVILCVANGANINQTDKCERGQKTEDVGFNIHTRRIVTTDVGECQPAELMKSEAVKPVCVPKLVTLYRYVMVNGDVKEVGVIKQCQANPLTCQRSPLEVNFYPETTYSQIIDVGTCGGLCRGKIMCRPTRNITKMINTPNGPRCIEVIAECSCVPKCYRMIAFEGFPVLKKGADGEAKISTEVIDIGRCVGDVCSYRNWTFPQIVTWPREKLVCHPSATRLHPIVTPNGLPINITIIESCDCK